MNNADSTAPEVTVSGEGGGVPESLRDRLLAVAGQDDLSWMEKVSLLAGKFHEQEQVECPVKSRFAPGVYLREIFMPAGSFVIGKIHKTEHFNIIQSGRVVLIDDEGSRVLEGPCTFVSKAGVRKVLYIETDCVWSTVHPTDETDLVRLEALLIEPSEVHDLLEVKS